VFSYVAYGLAISSEVRLPELEVGDGAPDVVLRLGNVVPKPLEPHVTEEGIWATEDEACRTMANVATCLVRRGREIIVDPAPGVDERLLRLSILGPALALVLHQRGRFVLHASAVGTAYGAVAFAGRSGCGKSTLAAALHARGCALVADDLTAVDTSPECPTVSPGFPQLKLWSEAVASLGEAPEALPRLHPEFDKRARRATRGFSHRALPLRRIYLLGEGPRPAIEPLPSHEALLALIPHWYGFRFGHQLLRVGDAAAANFRRCASLAKCVDVRRLVRPRELGALDEVARLVERDLASAPDAANVQDVKTAGMDSVPAGR
jgi:hypothetical protein